MKQIKAPKHHNFQGMREFLKKRNAKTKNKYDIIRSPCDTCITLPICLNKSDNDILQCPLLHPIFYRIALSLDYPSDEQNQIVRLEPLGITFWIQRDAVDYAHVDIVVNGVLQFISYRIEFDGGDIENDTI